MGALDNREIVYWSVFLIHVFMVEGQYWDDYGSGSGVEDCDIQYADVPSYFLPFGPGEGDVPAPVNDDASLGPIQLTQNFTFFGQTYDMLWINTNGGVSFKNAIYQFVPQAFPLPEDYTMIVPYWTDIDTTRNDGRIYYRQSTDPSLLEGTSLSHLRTARDLALFVATWHNVTYFGGSECTKINTFQLVLVSAGSVSYTMFYYGDMQWIISASTANALAGYNAGDMVNYYELPGSRTADMSPLTDYSNVHVPGQWVFRVDGQSGRVCESVPTYNTSESTYPELGVCSPTLTGPVVEDEIYVTFYCEVTIATSHPDTRAEVTFLFDGEPSPSVPVYTINSTTNVPLHEKYLHNNMGKTIECKVLTFWKDEPDAKSPETYSNKYYVGMKATTSLLEVSEAADTLDGPSLYSTLPITCSSTSGIPGTIPNCEITVGLLTSANTYVYTRNTADNVELQCRYTLRSVDWNSTEQRATNRDSTLVVRMKQEPLTYNPEDGSVSFRMFNFLLSEGQPLQKRDQDGQTYDNFWYSDTLGELKVYRASNTPSAMCYSSGDPQMSTFDGIFYSAQQQGVFVLARSNSSRVFEVQVRHWACVEGETGCSVVCAVAVHEGNVTYGLDMCNPQKTVHRLRLSEMSLPYKPISAEVSRRQWMIRMPSGAYIHVHIRTWGRGGMNVYVHVPPRDRGRTEGLCGTYDGDAYNDLKMANGTLVNQYGDYDALNSFIESWRVDPDDSLFKRGTVQAPSDDDQSEFCSCELENLNELVCLLRMRDNELLDQIYPYNPMDSFIVRRSTSSVRRKRSTAVVKHSVSKRAALDVTSNGDDDFDDTYVFDNVEEDGGNPEYVTWPTWNGITEYQASSYCQSFLLNNTMSGCTIFVTREIYMIVEKCVKDIQITGDYSWANDKVADVQQSCVQNVVTSPVLSEHQEELLNVEIQNIIDESCPEQCSGHGACQSSICVCQTEYTGPDCSVATGAVPRPQSFLSTAACDVVSRPCNRARLLGDNLINSDQFTCRIMGQQMDGTVFTQQLPGLVTSYNEAECPLAALYSMDVGGGPRPFYRYNISLSNDGTVFSEPLSPSGSRSGAVVYDSTCIQCTDDGSCHKTDGTCLVDGICYSDGEPDPSTPCKVCNAQVESATWSSLTVNNAPSLWMTWFSKLPGTTLNTSLSVYDVESHSVRYMYVAGDTPGVSVSESGHLLWTSDTATELPLHVVDECGAWRQETVQLVSGCSQCATDGPRERCVADGSDLRCECPPGYTGELCATTTDSCQLNPCVHGSCHDLVGRYTCACNAGYTGTECSNEATICDPNPCLNVGTCESVTSTEYKCHCRPDYTGPTCEINIKGMWDEWSAFGECSKSCDYGVRTRTRTCLVEQCDGLPYERELCNAFNCEEDPAEDSRSVILVLPGATISQIAFEVETISNLTATLLSTHCQGAVEDCCEGMKYSYSMSTGFVVAFFIPDDILTGKGTPKEDTSGSQVRLKLLVYKSHEALRDVCGETRVAESRRRRAALDGNYLDQSLLHDVLAANLHAYETALGVTGIYIYTANTTDEGVSLWVIIVAAIGGFVLLLAIIGVALVCTRDQRSHTKA